MSKRKIKVVLPAYNEELALPPLLKRLDSAYEEFGLNMEILVVNDGSTDKTAEVARNFKGNIKVEVLDLNPNRGLAGAIKAGLFEAVNDCKSGDDIIIVMDADNTHTPGLIMRMVRLITEGCDVVIASRYQPGSRVIGLTPFRRLLSDGASWLFRIVVGIRGVRDYTCGYRAYRVEVLKKAFQHYKENFIRQSGFGCMIEILLRINKFDPIIQEVPLILRYDFKEGQSKMKVWKTIKQTLKLLLNYRFSKDF
jgi:dolichol-phosphate mannosyltransferase